MTTEEGKVYDDLSAKYLRVSTAISPLFKRFNQLEDNYLYHNQNANKAAQSQVFDPISFEQVEHVVSHLFATRPRGRFIPREPNDTRDTMIVDEVYKYQWGMPGQNMYKKLVRMGKQMGIFGTAFGLLQYRYERKGVDGKMVCTFDAPFFKDLYIYDCYPDIDAMYAEDMQFFIHDEYLTLAELKAANQTVKGSKRYINLGTLEERFKGNAATATQPNTYRDEVNRVRKMANREVKDRILVRRMYTKDKWYAIAPDYNLVIENMANPYEHGRLPIHTLLDHDYVNQLYGIGELDPIRSMQIAHNQNLNMRLDNVRLILDSPMQAKKSALKHAHTWKFNRSQIMVVDNDGDIKRFEIPDTTGQTFQSTANFFKDSMGRAMGRFDILSRTEQPQDRTATEIKAALGEQNARLKYKETNVDIFIESVVTQWMQLNQQFLTQPKVIRIVGKEALESLEKDPEMIDGNTGEVKDVQVGKKKMPKFAKASKGEFGFLAVEPDDIVGQYDFVVETGSMTDTDPSAIIQNYGSALGLLQKNQPALDSEGYTIHYAPIIDSMLNQLGVKSIDRVLTKKEEPETPAESAAQGEEPDTEAANYQPQDMAAMQAGNQQIPPELAALAGQQPGLQQ